jgi:hypothetical protein
MKKLLLTALSVALLATAHGQKIKDQDLTFKYQRLPSTPLAKTITAYNSAVVLPYEAENAQKKADYDKKLQYADQQYKLDMETYTQQQKEADDQYNKEMEEYNKKSGAQKLIDKKVLDESKPTRRIVPVPYKQIPVMDNIKKEYDKSLLADMYVKLDGYEKGTENAVKITLTIYGFDNSTPEMKTSTMSVYNPQGQSTQKSSYYYEFQYRLPMSVKVEADGKVLMNQNFEDQTAYQTFKSKSYDRESDLRNANDPKVIVDQTEDKVLKENIAAVMEAVNSRFGKSTIERKTILNNIESKKMDYSDYEQAFEKSIMGYNKIAGNKAEGQTNLKDAIAVWEKAMTESNPDDKKARIDAGVTMATLFNLSEAYIFVDDYEKAEVSITKIMAMDPSKKEKKAAEELLAFMQDQKSRFEANKG